MKRGSMMELMRAKLGGVTMLPAASTVATALMAGPLGWTPEEARAAAESYAATVEEGRRRWR